MMRLFVVLLLLFPIVAFSAQDSSDDEAFENEIRAKIEKEKLERLKGWNRLVFRCSVPVNANPKEMFDRICSRDIVKCCVRRFDQAAIP